MKVLLTGGTGFHGTAIRSAIEVRTPWRLRLLSRDLNRVQAGSEVEIVAGDLTDSESLSRALVGIEMVIHAGGYIGYDETLCRQVNIDGTANLVRAAKMQGVRNLLYISSTSIYGRGPHRGNTVGDIEPSPSSVLSRSRLEAENLVRDAGGTVVRPSLVYGVGDRWVVPSIIRLTRQLGGEIDEGRSLLSLVRVNDLATLIVRLAGEDLSRAPGKIWHASNIAPISVATILDAIRPVLYPGLPGQSVSWASAVLTARAAGLSTRQIEFLGVDHWYEASEIWHHTRLTSPTGLSLDNEELTWYRELIRR